MKKYFYFIFCSIIFSFTHAFSVKNDLIEKLDGLSITSPVHSNIIRDGIDSNRHTHTPQNGSALYITDNSKISFPSKKGTWAIPVFPTALKDLCAQLNHKLYFDKKFGGSSNHLFASLGITYKKIGHNQHFRKTFLLTWSPVTQKFNFSESNPLGLQTYYADFYNHTSTNWETEDPIDIDGKKVEFVTYSSKDIPGVVQGNRTHSEPGLLGLLSSQKQLIADAINQLPVKSKIKVIQLFFHSFLDFCSHCEPMVQQFQRNFGTELLQYLPKHLSSNHFLFSKRGHKPDRVIFMIHGVNNRLYKLKPYFYHEARQEKQHTYSGYFLENYRPYPGTLIFQKEQDQELRLLTFINEPIGQGIKTTFSFGDLGLMIPLDRAILYWRLKAHHLYGDLVDFKKLVSPHLLMVDLKDARLGVREEEDEGDCYSASHGDELKQVLTLIQPCKKLKYLNLSGNWITSDPNAMSQMPNLLKGFQSLTYLNLSRTGLHTVRSMEFVSKALDELHKLEHLDLSRNGFNADIFGAIQDGIGSLSQLVTLNLSHNRLAYSYDLEEDYKGSVEEDTIEALGWITDFIHNTPSLLKVKLTNNHFDSIYFSWSEVAEQSDLNHQDMKQVLTKLRIEEDAGNDDLESETEPSDESESDGD